MQDFYFTLSDNGQLRTVRVRASNASEAQSLVSGRYPNAGSTLRPISKLVYDSRVGAGHTPVTIGAQGGDVGGQSWLYDTALGMNRRRNPDTGIVQFQGNDGNWYSSRTAAQATFPQEGGGTGGTGGTGGAGGDGAGGGGGTVPPPPGPEETLLERELADPAAAFRSFLEGQNLPTRGFTGGALRSAGRFLDPVISLSEAAGLNAPGAGLTDRLSGIFSQGGITRGLGSLANQSLQALGGAVNPNASQQPFITPESFGSDEAVAVRQALQQALTGRNPFLGSRFGSQIDQELGRRVSDSAFAGNDPLGTNFIRWAMSQVPT